MRCFSKLKAKLRSPKAQSEVGEDAPPVRVPIPVALRDHFEEPEFTPVDPARFPNCPVVKMAQLSAGEKHCQVVYREDTMLDLSLLTRNTETEYHRMGRPAYRRTLTRARLNLIPPIPTLTGYPTWVDTRVDGVVKALVDITGNRDYMLVTRSTLATWLTGAPRDHLTMSIQEVDPGCGSIEADEDEINASIRKLTKLRIQRRLKDTLELPPLPGVARRIIELRSDPNGNVGDLVHTIESDPILAANVMRWANSSAYSHAGDIVSVHDAVNRVLGYDMVMNLSMGLVLGNVMKVPEHETTHVLSFWEQSIWVAHATATLAELIGDESKVRKGLAYLAGLLHNFGYPVLSHAFPPHFRLITESNDINRHMDVSLIDAHILGITREQVAAELMANWMITEEVVCGVRFQKYPEYDGDHHLYANLIYLARSALIDHDVRLGARAPVPDYVYQRLGLTPEGVAKRIGCLLKQEKRIMSVSRLM